jgi:hypothetical protein
MRRSIIVGYETEEDYDEITGISKPAGYDEVKFAGRLERLTPHPESGDQVNQNLRLDMSFSFVASEKYRQRANSIRYVIVDNSKWKVSGIEILPPRLRLQIGDLFNEQPTGTPS